MDGLGGKLEHEMTRRSAKGHETHPPPPVVCLKRGSWGFWGFVLFVGKVAFGGGVRALRDPATQQQYTR